MLVYIYKNNINILTSFPLLQLHVDLWGPMDEWIPAIVHSRLLSQMRVLLQGPDCRVWYLEDRVRGWEASGRARRVPITPPCRMFHTHLLRGEPLATAFRGTDADELCDRSKRRYLEFARAQLLQRVGPADPLFQATAGGSSSQVSLYVLVRLYCTCFDVLLNCSPHYCLLLSGTCSRPSSNQASYPGEASSASPHCIRR